MTGPPPLIDVPTLINAIIGALVTGVTVTVAVLTFLSRQLRGIEARTHRHTDAVEARLTERMDSNQESLANLVRESKEDRHELRGAIQAVSNRVAIVEGILMGRQPRGVVD